MLAFSFFSSLFLKAVRFFLSLLRNDRRFPKSELPNEGDGVETRREGMKERCSIIAHVSLTPSSIPKAKHNNSKSKLYKLPYINSRGGWKILMMLQYDALAISKESCDSQ